MASNERNLNTFDALANQKGSFCDTDSQTHYQNVSESEAEEAVEEAESRGDRVNEYRTYDSTPSGRVNLSHTTTDRLGFDYPTKEGPDQ